MHLLHDIKDVERFDEILKVFFEEGFEYFVYKLEFHDRIRLHSHIKNRLKRINRLAPPIRLRMAFERLGPTFIKLGQVLSVRPDLIPKDYVLELEKLQEHTPKIPYHEVKQIIEQETGKKLEEIFSEFRAEPVATASISQVHIATLKQGGRVAVKVQKPGIKELITKDLDILFFLAHVLNKYFEAFKNYDLVNIIKEFATWTMRELDFKQEAENIKRFRANLKEQKVIIPRVFEDYSTEKLLVMEFEGGEHLLEHVFKEEERKKFMKNITDVLCKMIFEDGFFHADPHPGNIFVGRNSVPILLDFGMVGTLSPDLKAKVCESFVPLLEHNTDQALGMLLALTDKRPNANIEAFRQEAKMILERWYGQPVGKCSFIRTFYDILGIGARNGIVFPAELVLLAKSMLGLEGLALQICPEVKVEEAVRPYIQKVVMAEYDPTRVAKKTFEALERQKELYTQFPEHVMQLLQKIESGTINLHIDRADMLETEEEMSISGNKKALAVIIAALFLSSAFFFYNQKDIHLLGIRIGTIELVIAFILLVYLLKHMAITNEKVFK